MQLSRLALLVLFSLVLISFANSGQAASSAPSVLVLNLHEEIDPGSSHFITSQLSEVSKANTAAVIIDMNTPGGIIQNMLKMITAIQTVQSEGIPVYTYIPAYGGGASAGSYVAMACNGIYMGNGTVIGPSTPIVVGGTSLEQNHTENYFIAYMGALASEQHRNVSAAEIMVSQNIAFNGTTAIAIGLVNGYSYNLTALIAHLNLTEYPIITQNPGFYDNFLSFLSNTTVDGMLILIGSVAILADIYHGTALLTILGVSMMALGLLGAEIVGASTVGIVLVLLGAAFIFLEAKTGHGFSLIAGVIVSIFGTFMLASPYLSPNQYPYYSPSPFGFSDYFAAFVIAVVVVFIGFLVRRIALSLRARKYTGSEALIGKIATVKKTLSPSGLVSVEGIQWRAQSEDGSAIAVNEKVVVVGRDELLLIVKKA